MEAMPHPEDVKPPRQPRVLWTNDARTVRLVETWRLEWSGASFSKPAAHIVVEMSPGADAMGAPVWVNPLNDGQDARHALDVLSLELARRLT